MAPIAPRRGADQGVLMLVSRLRPARLLVPLTVAAVVLMVLVTPTATAPTAAPRPAAHSLDALPVVASSATVRAISHNMCGGQCKAGSNNGISELEAAITSYNPQVLMLQEVCLSHYN